MKKYINFSLILFFSILAMPVLAQQVSENKINVTSGELTHKGDSMYIHMMIDISGLSIDKNRSLTLTPVLIGTAQQKVLPEILINGTTRHKVYQRSLALGGNTQNISYDKVIKLDKSAPKELHYMQAVPYERWMESSHLDLRENLCGCGGKAQELAVNRITDYTLKEIKIYNIEPKLAYIQPEAEKVKSREDQWESYLDFPVNKTEILPTYMNNPSELSKIESLFKSVELDNNLTVSRIDIIGFASPEGSLANNEKLSKGRAETFKSYLVSKLNFPASTYNVEYGGENWTGLEMALASSGISDKEALLDIIKNTSDINVRKNKLKTLNKGVPYRQMLTDIYPKLRKVISYVHYTVRGFSVDEAKEVIKTHPQQLSLNEMFLIANTYPAGSNSFTEVFETAVRMFPSDKIANLNAAAAALSAKDIDRAKRYLDKSDKNSSEYANNMGVLYILQGNWEQAKSELNKASLAGNAVAKYNLQEIEKKMQIESLNKD